jgi:N-acetylglucosaminyldiphosphoundecaprenol N-acetyl-beta-D-mannosaminyltransferase
MTDEKNPLNDVVKVLDVPLYAKDITRACDTILSSCLTEGRANRCVSATGAHGMVLARKDKNFRQILTSFFLNLPDGMPGVWIGRIKGKKQMKRCYGPEFFQRMMEHSKDLEVSHFFCGGNSGVAEALKQQVYKKFANNRVVGTFCPPFLPTENYDYESLAKQINSTNANIVWIGLSTPKQEAFAANLSKSTNVNYIITVGAAFDFHTDKVIQAPKIIQKLGFEWLFRLTMEPRRLYRRYLEVVPLFIYYNITELFNFKPLKK